MAGWNRNLSPLHQSFADAIFNAHSIECKSQFCWLPMYDEWQVYFKTKFRYLHINELVKLTRSFLETYDNFVKAIEDARAVIEREYKYYFNELWC